MEELEDCGTLLTADILRECDDNSVGGIEVNALLFNRADIDYTLTTFSPTSKTTITNLVLKTGKMGFWIKGIKQVNNARFELVKKELVEDMYRHSFGGVLPNASAKMLDRLEEMKSNESGIVALVETKFKGLLQADAFKLVGFNSGLKLQTSVWGTNENDATVAFELASDDGYEEPKPVLTVLETDYTVTKTAFDNRFEDTP